MRNYDIQKTFTAQLIKILFLMKIILHIPHILKFSRGKNYAAPPDVTRVKCKTTIINLERSCP